MVVFRCREQNNQMNGCLKQYTANDAFYQEFKAKRLAQHEKEREERMRAANQS